LSDQDDTSPDNQSDLMSSVGLKVKNLKPIQRNGTNGNLRVFKLLNVIEFSSDRKRMSVIIKTPNNEIKVLTKGADSVLIPLL
jgi:magnesium-transporting ATPase (P-type)